MRQNDWGFASASGMSAGSSMQMDVPGALGMRWCTTSMMPNARNHCASVMIANLALCLGVADSRERREILKRVYEKVGDGPILMAPTRARSFLVDLGRKVVVRPWVPYDLIPGQIARGRPSAVLLRQGLRNWHWTLCIGWRQYRSGQLWLHLADSWHEEAVYCMKGRGSRFVYAASFSPDE